MLYDEMSICFPMHCAILKSRSNAIIIPTTHQPFGRKEKHCTLSLFDSLPPTKQGLSMPLVHDGNPGVWGKRVSSLAVERQIATSPNHAFGVLDNYLDQGTSTLTSAIALEVTLNAEIDNYNRSRNKTFQAGDKSALMHKATVMYYDVTSYLCWV
jgi:hypothetical protein